MRSNDANKTNQRLQALINRRAALDAALRTEKEKRKVIAQREDVRFARIVGRAVLANAAETTEAAARLKGILGNARLSESERKVAHSKGWL